MEGQALGRSLATDCLEACHSCCAQRLLQLALCGHCGELFSAALFAVLSMLGFRLRLGLGLVTLGFRFASKIVAEHHVIV